MGMYRKEWDCCGSVTETNAWEPESCPFCKQNIEAVEPALKVAVKAAWQVLIDAGVSPGPDGMSLENGVRAALASKPTTEEA